MTEDIKLPEGSDGRRPKLTAAQILYLKKLKERNPVGFAAALKELTGKGDD